MRWGKIIIALALMLGCIFALMSSAYALGGLAEKHLFTGASFITNILILMLLMVMLIATLLTLAERKWSSFMQDRVGPNRARLPVPGIKNSALGGLPHIASDVLKMLTKEAFRPKSANKFLFNLGPIMSFAPVFALFAIIPAGPTVEVLGKKVMMVAANPDFGLLFIFAIASLAVYGTALAGWASNNKFGLLGGVRASSQLVSYEVPMGLSLVGLMLAFSTIKLTGAAGITDLQAHYLWSLKVSGFDIGVPQWGFLLQPLGFLIFFAAAFAETKRAPFDAPEGESEIVGYFIEYSGMQFGMFMIAEFVEIVVLSGVLTAVFFGGYHLPFGNEWLASRAVFVNHPWLFGALMGTVFWIKVILLCYLQLAIRWTFPRFRYDQIQTLGWKILLPLGLANIFISGALVLYDSSLHALALSGLVVLGVFVLLTAIPPRQMRLAMEAQEAHDNLHHPH